MGSGMGFGMGSGGGFGEGFVGARIALLLKELRGEPMDEDVRQISVPVLSVRRVDAIARDVLHAEARPACSHGGRYSLVEGDTTLTCGCASRGRYYETQL